MATFIYRPMFIRHDSRNHRYHCVYRRVMPPTYIIQWEPFSRFFYLSQSPALILGKSTPTVTFSGV